MEPGESEELHAGNGRARRRRTGTSAELGVGFDYRQGLRHGSADGAVSVKVDPLITLKTA